MVRRIQIRNRNSAKDPPPRVFDVLLDGTDVNIEVKNGKAREIVSLDDVIEQIKEGQDKST